MINKTTKVFQKSWKTETFFYFFISCLESLGEISVSGHGLEKFPTWNSFSSYEAGLTVTQVPWHFGVRAVPLLDMMLVDNCISSLKKPLGTLNISIGYFPFLWVWARCRYGVVSFARGPSGTPVTYRWAGAREAREDFGPVSIKPRWT